MNKSITVISKIITIIIAGVSLNSCMIFTPLIELPKEDVNIRTYQKDDHIVKFIGTHHLGKEEYYASLKESIIKYKKVGFKVYYELVDNPVISDSAFLDSLNRKMRRIYGFMPTIDFYDAVTAGTIFESLVPQPEYLLLGVDSLDFKADVTTLDMVQYFENKYGKVILNQQDFNIPINGRVPAKATRSQMIDMTINYRNEVLAKVISSAPEEKILIIYGLGHRKGFYKDLKKIDDEWKKSRK